MGLNALLTKLDRRAVTPVTAIATADVTAKPASLLACTAVTSATAGKDVAADSLKVADAESVRADFEERAAIMEYDGGLSREEAEQRAWAQTLEHYGLPIGYLLH